MNARPDVEHMSKGALIAYIGDLEMHIETMSGGSEAKTAVCHAFRLTGSEADMLLALRSGKLMSKEQLHSALFWRRNESDTPGMKIIDVFACKIRKKLLGSGVHIETMWGLGYRLVEVDLLEAIIAGQPIVWREEIKPEPLKKPVGAITPKGRTVRARVLDYLRGKADANGRVRIVAWEIYEALGIAFAATKFRNLEQDGKLVVEQAAKRSSRGREDRYWHLRLL